MLPPHPPAAVAAKLMERADLLGREVDPATGRPASETLHRLDLEVDALVREHAVEWLATTEALLADEIDRARRLMATTVEAIDSICELLGARVYLTRRAAGEEPVFSSLRAFSGFDKPNGEPFPLATVLGEVLVWLDRVDGSGGEG